MKNLTLGRKVSSSPSSYSSLFGCHPASTETNNKYRVNISPSLTNNPVCCSYFKIYIRDKIKIN